MHQEDVVQICSTELLSHKEERSGLICSDMDGPRVCPPDNAGDTGSIPGSGRFPGAEMVTHSNILAWEMPWTEEPGGLQSLVSPRVGHD